MDQGLTIADLEGPANFLPGTAQSIFAATSFAKLLALLPEPARPKLERLTDARANAHAIVRDASHKLEELQQARLGREIERDVRFAELRRRATDEESERFNEPVERALAEEKRAQARYDAAVEGWERWGFVERAIEWLMQAHRDRLRLRVAKVSTVKASDDHRAVVARIRAELVGLEEAWTTAERAPLPIADARENLFREIDAIAARGAPTVDLRRRAGSPIPIEKALQVRKNDNDKIIVGDYGASLFVWLLHAEMKDKLGAMLDGSEQDGALTDEARDRRFGEIAAKRLELERLEEAHIVAAEAVNLMISRRDDADLRAILEVDA